MDRNAQDRVIATVVSAFISDPVERWLWRDASQYLTHFPTFVAAFGSAAFDADTVCTLEGFAAVALWIPPGAAADGDRIVVDAPRQDAGLGGRLLARGLARVDADHLPAYLETPNPRTVPFYERHGFEVVGTSQAGECPPMTSMLRAAR